MIKEEIKSMIHKMVREAFNENNTKQNEEGIDITKISIEDLKKGYVDLRLVPTSVAFNDGFSEKTNLKESIGDILPPDKVVNTLVNRYNIPQTFILVKEHYHKIQIYIVTAVIGINDKIIEEAMNKMGYFLGLRQTPKYINGMTFQVLQFEPYSQMQDDETEEIKKNNEVLYHWTPLYNLIEIFKKGLIPSHKNKVFNYPDRIYLMENRTSLNNIYKLGYLLCLNNNDANNNGEYVLLSVDIKNLDDTVRFYYDPNSEIGIYTESSIPKENVRIVNKVNFFKNNEI